MRVRLKVTLRLTGLDRTGHRFEVVTTTENLGRCSFLCTCSEVLDSGSGIEVHLRLAGSEDQYVGKAEIIRSEWNDTHYPRYGCQFKKWPENWVLQ